MKLAAIDIGSNAIRLQIVNVFESKDKVSFKSLEFLRFPLRLGHDVFKKGKILPGTTQKFGKLMQTFRLLIELYDVDATFAVATSAMREAENGQEIRDVLEGTTGIDVHIISGTEEARILNKAILPYLTEGRSVHIDVGGGSTELNLYEGRELKASQSFRIGSVRKLSAAERKDTFSRMQAFLKKTKNPKSGEVTGIGTGGNMNKLFKLSSRTGKTSMSLVEIKAISAYVKAFSYEERMSFLKLNPDRADVIIPASEIYIRMLEDAGGDTMLVPKVGLKDGIIYELYERTTGKNISEIEYISGI
ncbi:Ppx/GppA phosphatase family protein [Neolewinella persica]|uniref:Ppx/GppA phosphatase family protein n=1 Tax=Neolewinella persica TaxID=70998 RepID=UPI0003618FA9|nr:hypothetical protein [Neolewinella persica]